MRAVSWLFLEDMNILNVIPQPLATGDNFTAVLLLKITTKKSPRALHIAESSFLLIFAQS
ncbi:MAG: hypothetical protein ABIO05_03410 [Ferruginibacter sp.]